MPNLVGTGLNQVPSNSMLGGMAYQDPDRVKIKKLHIDEISQINSEIAETATDIFVYDTSRDSDGGAWRKRTTDRSWYNETLGTSTRGTRKEFPAVAVIVAEDAKLTIYDGDDPNLPMWMVFNLLGAVGNPNSNMLPRGGSGTESDITSIACLNGRLAVGLKDVSGTVGEGLAVIDFISELARIHRTSASGYTGAIYNSPISGRNSNGEYYGDYNSLAVVAETINDVAMTVLPNAPIDDATGLPVPTIAVATAGGVSVIRDDGIVYDLNVVNRPYSSVDFTSDNLIFAVENPGGVTYDLLRYFAVLSADITTSPSYGPSSTPPLFPSNTKGNFFNNHAYGSPIGLTILDHVDGTSSSTNGMVAYITSDYNSGYQHGDIKGAFLSDTDTTNLVDTNLVSNGTFDSNTTGWSSSGNITVTQDAGRLKMVSGSGNPFVYTAVTCVVGKRYYVQLDVQGEVSFHAGPNASSSGDVAYIPYSSHGSLTTKHCFFVATATTMYLVPHVIGTGNTGYIDNVICKLADHDRTRNGAAEANVGGVNGRSNGLAVYGTITKSAVATGAELVSYSGFSLTNKLIQPYNSDMNYGTGDLYIMLWAKHIPDGSSIAYYLFDRADTDATNRIGAYYIPSSRRLDIYSPSQTLNANGLMPSLSEWTHIAFVRQNSIGYLYVNGNLIKTQTGMVENLTGDGTAELKIGSRFNGAEPWTIGNLALFRTGSSTPSATQIKKIYEDEKHLFQENAKCTLYGSSNAVTGLAHDDSTDILHVGTSAGRSEFQGLCRINNTTTAVTTAISAHDEFIIEQ